MDNTKSILYLNRISEIGGAEVSLQELMGSLEGTGYWPVVVLGGEGPLLQRLQGMGIEAYTFPFETCHYKNPLPFIRTIIFLKNIIKKHRIKLIHSNMFWDNQYGVISAKLSRIPHVLHVRGFVNSQYTWKSFYCLGTVVICNSQHTCHQFICATGFKKRVEVVYNGIDVNLFKPDRMKRSATRKNYGFTDNDFVMGMAGSIIEEKGQFQLLKSIHSILIENRNYKVLIAGNNKIGPESDYYERIKAFIANNKLEDQVLLLDFVEDMPSFYNALDVFLLPSFKEPFGRVLIEAMATKIPIVASNVDGVPEVVGHGKTGYLVDSKDGEGWRQHIKRLVDNEGLRKELGEVGRQRVIDNFTLDHVTSRIVSIYNSLIK